MQLMAIHEDFLQEHFIQISDPASFKPLSAEEVFQKHEAALSIGYDPESRTFNVRSNPEVLLIPVIGPTEKLGGWSSSGTMDMGAMLTRAKNSGKYKAALIYMDSPGGAVDGMSEWGSVLMNAGMPTLTFVDGYAASGGYWQAVSTDRILANSQNQNFIGSIGVQTLFVDKREMAKTQIGEVKILRAAQSTMKNMANSFEELTKEAEAWIVERLTEAATIFIDHVQSRMPGIDAKSDAFKGQVYSTAQAIEEGLIHGTATFDEAVQQLLAMVPTPATSKTQNQSQNQTNKTMKFKSTMLAILGAIGFANVASEEESPAVTEERLEAINASLNTAHSTISTHEATIAQLQNDLNTANASLTTATTERDTFKALAEKHGKQAGAAHTPPKKEKAEGGNEEQTATQEDEFKSYAHNQEALKDISKFS